MLDVSYHGGWAVAGVDIVLLDAGVTANGEEGSSGAIVADGGNAFGGRHSLIRYPLSADVPGTSLAVAVYVST